MSNPYFYTSEDPEIDNDPIFLNDDDWKNFYKNKKELRKVKKKIFPIKNTCENWQEAIKNKEVGYNCPSCQKASKLAIENVMTIKRGNPNKYIDYFINGKCIICSETSMTHIYI